MSINDVVKGDAIRAYEAGLTLEQALVSVEERDKEVFMIHYSEAAARDTPVSISPSHAIRHDKTPNEKHTPTQNGSTSSTSQGTRKEYTMADYEALEASLRRKAILGGMGLSFGALFIGLLWVASLLRAWNDPGLNVDRFVFPFNLLVSALKLGFVLAGFGAVWYSFNSGKKCIREHWTDLSRIGKKLTITGFVLVWAIPLMAFGSLLFITRGPK